jgi:hypothetical protein
MGSGAGRLASSLTARRGADRAGRSEKVSQNSFLSLTSQEVAKLGVSRGAEIKIFVAT